jgi:Mg-chelatase subunit ChlD
MMISYSPHTSKTIAHWTMSLIIGGSLAANVGCSTDRKSSDTGGEEIVSVELLGVTPTPDFAETGKVVFSVLPYDADGEIVFRTDIEVEITVEALESSTPWGLAPELDAADVVFEVLDTVAKEADERQLACALDIDSSGSMHSTDPARLRVDAAQDFVGTIADLRSDSEYGIFTFRGSDRNFEDTEVLQDFTDDSDAAALAIEQVRQDTDTPLYGSTYEVIEYTHNTRNAADHQGVVVVFSDGQPTDWDRDADDVTSLAVSRDIPIFTVGLGPASQTSPDANSYAVQVMQELASATGGAYASADSPEELSDIFERVATGIAVGSVEIPAETGTIPTSGTSVSGTISIDGMDLSWTFMVP